MQPLPQETSHGKQPFLPRKVNYPKVERLLSTGWKVGRSRANEKR